MASAKAKKLVVSWAQACSSDEKAEVEFAIQLAILIQLEDMTKAIKDITE